MLTLIESQANVVLYGSNGSGKTQFVKDCVMYQNLETPLIYIDCIEFYSEKLISISMSHQINATLQAMGK